MASEVPIVTEATVSRVVDNRAYRVALPNGKTIVAHVPARLAPTEPLFGVGDTVTLEMTPYDFDHARIRVILKD